MATDVNTEALQKAQTGIYSLKEVEGVPYELLKTYFRLGTGPNNGLFRPYWDNISVKDPETLPEDTGQDECFIATAAFGTKFSPAVMLLRQFRDKYLLTNSLGRFFVEYYYKTSPPIAYSIAKNTILKKVVQVALIPAVIVAYLLMNPLLSILLFMCLMFIYIMYHKRKGVVG